VGSTYNENNRNLQILEKEGLIINDYPVKVRHGRVRVIRLNKENPKTQTLLKIMADENDALRKENAELKAEKSSKS
jgi:ribosomal protein L15E